MHVPQLRQLGVTPRMVKLSRNNLWTRNSPRLPPMLGGDTLAKDTQSKEGIIGSQPRGNHNVFTHYPKDLKCEVCKKTKTTRARCRTKTKKCVDKIAPSAEFGAPITADDKILNVENELRCGHKNALIVQNDFTNWTQSHPMKTQDTSETTSCLHRFLPPSQKQERDNSKSFMQACQVLQWSHDTSNPHRSETNGVAERAVSRVKERTAIALVQSGLPEDWWDSAMERCCYMRNVHDKMIDGKTAFEKRYGQTFDGPSIPFWNIG